MKSHVLLPRCVLKQFEDKNNALYLYYFQSHEIKKEHAKSINTKIDYYSELGERYLSNNVEEEIGNLIRFLKSSDHNFNNSDIDILSSTHTYLYSLISRSSDFIEEIDSMSAFFAIIDEQARHDCAVIKGTEAIMNLDLTEKLDIMLLYAQKGETFILPSSGWYYDIYNSVLCPITKKCVILFYISKNSVARNNNPHVIKLEPQIVRRLNVEAIKTSINNGCEFIATDDKDYLIQLVNEYGLPIIVQNSRRKTEIEL